MSEIDTLTSIRDSYEKRIEELKKKIVEENLEIQHCIAMKEAYDYMINIHKGVQKLDKKEIPLVKAGLNNIYGKNGEGKSIADTYRKEGSI